MSLQEKLDAIKADFEPKVPAVALAVMHRSTSDLIASGQAERALKVGDRAPEFSLPDADGVMTSSAELLKKGPLVLTFYRGVWCPYCNLDLKALEAVRQEIEVRGASLVAISPQTAVNSRKSHRENELGYPILADDGGAVAAAFGIRWALPDDLKQLYTQFGVDLQTFNGDASWTLPMPARYVIGSDGVIVYAEVNPDYTRRPEPQDIYPALDSLRRV